nr:hypothetical protein [uncultured Oscillibacter sp.]
MKLSPPFIKRAYAVLCPVFILLCLSASAFYIRVSFWGDVTKPCGWVWLALTVVFCIARLPGPLRRFLVWRRLSTLCSAVICFIQILAILLWLGLSDGRHTYVWSVDTDVVDAVRITPCGALFHLVILLVGAAVLYCLRKCPCNTKQP